MSDLLVVGFKLGIGAVSILLALALLSGPWIHRLSDSSFLKLAVGYTIASRVGTFVVYFLVLGIAPSSDINTYYLQARSVLAGLVPYRDFPNAYGPLFPRVAALAVEIWDSAKAIILLSITFEVLAVAFWILVARSLFDARHTRVATVAYVTSPLAITNVAINGHNQVWVSAFLACSLWAIFQKREAISGALLGASLVVVKLLALPFVPLFLYQARKRLRWGIWFLAAISPFYIFVLANGLNPFMVVNEIDLKSSGNLPFLLSILGIDSTQGMLFTGLLGVCLAFVIFAMIRHQCRGERLIHAISVVILTFMIASPKSYGQYLVIALFPLCISAMGSMRVRAVIPLHILGTLAVLEPSLWQRWIGYRDLQFLAKTGLTLESGAFLLVEITLIALYCWYLRMSWRSAVGEVIPPDRGQLQSVSLYA